MRRVRWLGLLTVLTMTCSTAAFALEVSALGAALGVLAGIVSALMVWTWIQSNGAR